MKIPKSVQDLIEVFEQLPGIGPKTAARLTYYLLHAPDNLSERLSEAAGDIKKKTKICSVCQNITEVDPCDICERDNRDKSIICIVEDPLDVWAIEKSGGFNGLYHVLHGVIAPLDNIGPEELKLRELLPRLKNGEVKELILATNPSMEGEATAMYIQRLIKPLKIKTTRIARGIPTGAEIEYADEITVRRAFEGRIDF
ncbi:recombination protein RecR [Candidatus Curtissbacteria bacterium RIFCSPLOWO2_01_FULL_39_62]|uniref:Recombination protein RecR n=2 Tax=Candidatus Curtissiibacteriota TaxID=1752717 RepID=A0A1F5G9F8_9BACT|nr:MAG: recombination protein RecR [Candidatus Curtissbacteria bacterium RIFCSPHIGHO2_01_FULL_39_57]OGD88465.1 MAG: recombination protein RecR [Candidatus Curtissbacteria bacterium RIFCSPHIGHO2_02_FULL_40_16b]OGD90889.1 MAG: recombination protein RecR [Candidatus Curtissbacteria bacterium RIFCSPHIGHO2_12_FULL_38_37]OGE00335.1 MAG: recombination protein RecR [Candidatus Curtissbacteria bacterium RIFCSPLOWO2_02_FULL_40_11]OGE00816.1 MAG: recombination protein RecR [Candidatus Curtissbacteria bact